MSLVEVNENTYQKEISEGTAILYFTVIHSCHKYRPLSILS